MQSLWTLSETDPVVARLRGAPAAAFGVLAERLRGHPRAVVDLGDQPVSAELTGVLTSAHRELREAGCRLSYAAAIPATRGLCVVALHQAGDPNGEVSVSAALALSAANRGRITGAMQTLGVDGVAPTPGRGLSSTERVVAQVAGWGGRMAMGVEFPFMEQMLSTYGMRGVGGPVGRALTAVLSEVEAQFGDWEGQILVSVAAIGNGCGFCGPGHLYAANLLYFEAYGAVLPLDEQDVDRMIRSSDQAIEDWMSAALNSAGLPEAAALVARVFALRQGAPPQDAADARLLRLLAAWTLINECSLQVDPGPIQAIHPRMSRARRLQRAYKAERAKHRAQGLAEAA